MEETVDRQLQAKSIAEAVNVANDLRKALGKDILDDLPPSFANDSHRCVLANAFNFDCNVSCYGEYDEWRVNFFNKDHAEKLAAILGEEVKTVQGIMSVNYWVKLPKSIGQIAYWFDAGDLDSKYYAG